MGLDEAGFSALPKPDQKSNRQKAKALNFGIPGGLGAKKLRAYAKVNYGVDFTPDEAYQLREKVIHQVYPEWAEWLTDGLASRLHITLGVPLDEAEMVLGQDNAFLDPMEHPAARVWAGEKLNKDGLPFATYFIEQSWLALEHCYHEGQRFRSGGPGWVFDRVTSHSPGRDLVDYLVEVPSVTLTGRSRANTMYGDWRNTQFQGLASDGIKLALWDLMTNDQLSRYPVVAMIHDELVLEVPESEAEDGARAIARSMEGSFSRVLGTDLPVRVETAVDDTWRKP